MNHIGTELRDRLDRLADAATEGVELTHPKLSGPAGPRSQGASVLVVMGAAAVALLVVAVAAALVIGDEGDDPSVVAANGTDDSDSAVVAVVYGYGGAPAPPIDLTLRFLDADSNLIAERLWAEAYVPLPGSTSGLTSVKGGLLQDVPAGDLQLEATLQTADGPVSCTQPFTVEIGDKLILGLAQDLEPDGEANQLCATIRSVDEWAGRLGSPSGESYIGLTEDEADIKAQAEGFITRVDGRDGMDLPVTLDARCDRIDLWVFEGLVVAAWVPVDTSLDCQNWAHGG